MKKIAILHASTTKNYGTMMLVINFIRYLQYYTNEKLIFYLDHDLKGVKRYKKATKIKNIRSLNVLGYNKMPNSSPDNNIFKKIYINYKHLKNYNKIFLNEKINNVVILGGDDISEFYSTKGLIKKLLQINKLKKSGINVLLYGQTIGPFFSYRKFLAKQLLKDIYISTRDNVSFSYLKNKLKLENITTSPDLAFLDLPLQKKSGENYLERYNLNEKKYIVLIPSGLWSQYTNNKRFYIENWIKIITKIRTKYEYKIVLLAHDIRKNSSDAHIIDNILDKLNNNRDIIKITEHLYPYNAREILGNSILSVTGRMHGAISTFQKGTPSISLSYSVKYEGVIGEGLKRSDLIIEASNNKYWNDFYITNEIIKKIDYVLQNYKKICKEIKINVDKNQKQSLNSLKKISKLISEN